MAVKDVRTYLYTVQAQYLEMKNDLADFEEALQAGYITEDRLEEIKDEVARLENNYHRLLYIVYLLELPNRKAKQPKYRKANKKLEAEFERLNATDTQVFEENKSILSEMRTSIKRLKDSN